MMTSLSPDNSLITVRPGGGGGGGGGGGESGVCCSLLLILSLRIDTLSLFDPQVHTYFILWFDAASSTTCVQS